ncbi:hypothetical protein FJT64_010956 [Amphibalanus amphitrite]|uniref:EB domain-containing protein n=1 Tax=Amphibalanus amphitrite TaxID=1232801 RepID=A0A6A4V8E4_AMPAM|nr:hypothetical protein FJT64_010956 [Amphibalanus amphitrite]
MGLWPTPPLLAALLGLCAALLPPALAVSAYDGLVQQSRPLNAVNFLLRDPPNDDWLTWKHPGDLPAADPSVTSDSRLGDYCRSDGECTFVVEGSRCDSGRCVCQDGLYPLQGQCVTADQLTTTTASPAAGAGNSTADPVGQSTVSSTADPAASSTILRTCPNGYVVTALYAPGTSNQPFRLGALLCVNTGLSLGDGCSEEDPQVNEIEPGVNSHACLDGKVVTGAKIKQNFQGWIEKFNCCPLPAGLELRV